MSRNTDYQFVDTDTGALEALMIAIYERLTGVTVRPASPEKLFIEWVASVVLQERAIVNYVGNQNIPSRAEGVNLDALGELFWAPDRPAAQAAVCTCRFRISAAQISAVLIPAGTRVTDASSTLYWETVEDAYIVPDETSVDTQVRCQTPGLIGNGWLAGQINTIVDVFDYYTGVENITASDGGTDAATDDEYYELLIASMYAYSTAGPEKAYEYHAKAVSTEIGDVLAVRPRSLQQTEATLYEHDGDKFAFLGGDGLHPETLVVKEHGSTTPASYGTDYETDYNQGLLVVSIITGGALDGAASLDISIEKDGAGQIIIYALMDDGTIAGDEIKAAILAACDDKSTRPLCDNVSVEDPDEASYTIDLTYYVRADSTAGGDAIAASVQSAVDQFTAWQSAKLGRDINPSYLIGLLMQVDGIKRVEVRAPVYTVLKDGRSVGTPQVAKVGTITVLNGGVEDE